MFHHWCARAIDCSTQPVLGTGLGRRVSAPGTLPDCAFGTMWICHHPKLGKANQTHHTPAREEGQYGAELTLA